MVVWTVDLAGVALEPDPEAADMRAWSSRFAPGTPGHGWRTRETLPPARLLAVE